MAFWLIGFIISSRFLLEVNKELENGRTAKYIIASLIISALWFIVGPIVIIVHYLNSTKSKNLITKESN